MIFLIIPVDKPNENQRLWLESQNVSRGTRFC